VDTSNLKTTDYLVGGGAIVFLISMFLKWYKAEFEGGAGFAGGTASVNGWHYFLFGIIPLILIIFVVVALVVPAMTGNDVVPDPVGPMPRKQAALIAAGIAFVLVLLRLILQDGDDGFGFEIKRGLGLYLATISSLAVAVGTLMKSQGTEDIKSIQMPNAGDFGGGGNPGGPPQPPQQF
jgi:hypothetical protein